MSETGTPPKRNYLRRLVGVVICFGPMWLFIASLIANQISPRISGMGIGLAVCALPFALLNFHLRFGRPALYRRRHGSLDGFRYVSGIPMFATMLLVMSGVVGFGDWRTVTIGLFVLAIDTGGSPWFLIDTWRDESFWDE